MPGFTDAHFIFKKYSDCQTMLLFLTSAISSLCLYFKAKLEGKERGKCYCMLQDLSAAIPIKAW